MAQQQSASPALSDFAVIVYPDDNVAVVKTAVDAGLSLEAPGGRTVTLSGAVTPGHRFATRAIPEGDVRAAVRTADRHVARHCGGRSDHAPEHEQRRAGRARSPGRSPHRAARLLPGLAGGDVAGLPPARRPRRHAQLRAHRPDQHVREPRVAADRDDRRVHPVQPREVSQRGRRGRHRAQQGLRLLGWLEHRGDAPHAVELRRPPQRRRRDLHRAGVREDEPHGRREVPAEGARRARQARHPLRHPGSGRHAGGDRSRPEGRGRHAPDRQPGDAQRRVDERADPRREVRRIGRLLRAVGQSCARPRRGSARALRRHGAHHRSARVLRRRAHSRAALEGSRHGRSGLRDGGLVQGIRLEVRDGAEREPEPGQRRGRPAEHHDQVARRHCQGRDHAGSRA